MTTIEETLTEVKFIGKPSRMGDKIIIIVPREFHKEIKPLIGKQTAVFLREAL